MNWRQDLGFDSETILVLDIACYFMECFFGCRNSNDLVNAYFEAYGKWATEDFIGHKLSWRMATEIYYCIALGGNRSDLRMWEIEKGWLKTPPDALAYMREHYWNREKNVDVPIPAYDVGDGWIQCSECCDVWQRMFGQNAYVCPNCGRHTVIKENTNEE